MELCIHHWRGARYFCFGWLVGKSPGLTRLMQLEGLLAVLAGVYCTLLGFGVVAPAKDPRVHQAMAQEIRNIHEDFRAVHDSFWIREATYRITQMRPNKSLQPTASRRTTWFLYA